MISANETLSLNIGSAKLVIPTHELLGAWLVQSLRREARPDEPPGRIAIGSEWPGEQSVYAGIVRGAEGAPDYPLLVPSAAAAQRESVRWGEAVEWVAGLSGGVLDGCVLPTRRELAVLFGNVPELFEGGWYWSSEQYAGNEAYAWAQNFGNGNQNNYHKDNELRARAVRRLTIR